MEDQDNQIEMVMETPVGVRFMAILALSCVAAVGAFGFAIWVYSADFTIETRDELAFVFATIVGLFTFSVRLYWDRKAKRSVFNELVELFSPLWPHGLILLACLVIAIVFFNVHF